MEEPQYLKWLVKEDGVQLNKGFPVTCYRIDYNSDAEVLDNWAHHIREHYIDDIELQEECDELEISAEEYLRQNIIPQKDEGLGSTARSNTISEILFSDLLEFVYHFEVPRYRQYNMSGKTVSEHGTDVIGYKFSNEDKTPDAKDELIAVEVKAGLTSRSAEVIEKAVIDSPKDKYRLAQSLNYMRRKLKSMGKTDAAKDIVRFQKKTLKDYKINYVAAGMSSLMSFQEKQLETGESIKIIPAIDEDLITIEKDTSIFYVHGKKLMELTHEIYERCTK